MAASWWGPFWVAMRVEDRDDADRLVVVRYASTTLHLANPTSVDGLVSLTFHEQRGDGNFYRSDWAGGTYSAPPMWQRWIRPDPSRVFGDSYYLAGWFEIDSSIDELLVDVKVQTLHRTHAGDHVAERTISLVPRPVATPRPSLPARIVDTLRQPFGIGPRWRTAATLPTAPPGTPAPSPGNAETGWPDLGKLDPID